MAKKVDEPFIPDWIKKLENIQKSTEEPENKPTNSQNSDTSYI
jgi:hypothetical protein